MNKLTYSVLLIAAALGLTSCGPNAKIGSVIGGLAGAGAGAIIGHQSGRALEGMAIGGAAGALGGAAVGSAADDREAQARGDYYYRNDYRSHPPRRHSYPPPNYYRY